ncbi:DegV family protein [Candidatus Viridilinea mediisalina]|uniref:Fatty acid-binding protein DegV n=1 Tax=Candidatus Viridilinea mediisalina TaxID=2024553 RepID=A0A2A6RMW1_9CHLR|nr:DegV family protein [Candidatus Viridilinea mediisalina]PDW04241.1 fatty acid-binding protein DegV [Candidatus Viridilinea mediisalina]
MAKITIVTDSSSDIDPELAAELGIEVVPVLAEVDGKVYRVGIDLNDDQIYELMATGQNRVQIKAPSSAAFEQIYRRLIGDVDYVFSMHLGARLGSLHANAAAAKSRLPASTTRLEVIDSKSASYGLGSIAVAAAQAARAGVPPDDLSRMIHATIRHTHVVFFVDTMEHLEASGRLTIAASVLGSMQRIKPLMILDEGEIVPYERTRTRAKAIEGLFTFVEDFPRVKEVTVLYVTSPEDVEKLLDKLDPIFPRDRVRVARFGPSIAIHLGPGAMGVAVFEGLDEG